METEYSEYRRVVEELFATKNKLAQAEEELSSLKAKKEKRRKKNEDSHFLNTLLRLRAKLKHQEGVNASLIRRVILKCLIKENYSNVEFFSKYVARINRLLAFKTFTEECEKHSPELKPEFVAQHVVLAGDAKINDVFKNGLVKSFDSKLLLMTDAIFTENELESLKLKDLSDGELNGLVD